MMSVKVYIFFCSHGVVHMPITTEIEKIYYFLIAFNKFYFVYAKVWMIFNIIYFSKFVTHIKKQIINFTII
mgnify:CR=1 FL=1